MSNIIQLFGQIFLIAIIQIVSDSFIDKSELPLQAKLINIACFLGSLYLILEFLISNILNSLNITNIYLM